LKVLVLISTIDDGLLRVPDILMPAEAEVFYIVSWQRTDAFMSLPHPTTDAEALLSARTDVQLTTLSGRGLCRNRNHAIDTALSCLDHPLEDAIFVIADDDERLLPAAFERLRAAYQRYPRMDGALWRLRSLTDGEYFKTYPPDIVRYGHHPRSYYPSSWEMTFRTRVWQTGLRFDERFGLGSEMLCAGEEDVLLTDMLRKGLNIFILPEDIALTEPVTTGSRPLNTKVLRSKGALYGYQRSWPGAVMRCLREAASLAVRHRRNPWSILQQLLQGVKYIRQCKKG